MFHHMACWSQKQWSVVLTKELSSPHFAWHGPLFFASTAPQDKAKINSPLSLTLPWFFIYTYDSATHLKIAMGLIRKLLSSRTSGISKRRHHLQQSLLNFFFLPQPTVQNNFYIINLHTHM